MTKRRTILAVVLGLIIALCLSFAVACGGDKGGDKTMSSVTWNIDDKENVTVTLEDGTEQLPETFAVGEELKFKVTPKTGYEVTVKVGSRGQTLTAKDGVYTYAVTGNSTVITITVTRTLKSVEVSTKPTKMTYFAGEELDPAGMVVTAKYEVGNDETVTAYTINYPTEGAAYFALGDTSFTVTYGGKTSAAVALNATVVGKVTLDTQGGQIADGYKTFLEGKKAEYGIDNIAVDATTHALTFTFASQLVKDIELPTAAMMTRGEGDAQSDYEFQAWNGGSAATAKVPAETAVSVEYKAVWKVHLLDLTKIYYNLGSEKVPQLIVEGKFRAAKSAYLFLYEGNDQVELKGPTIPATGEAKRGDDFKLTFDMREVVKKGYVGKWMDIKFVAESDGVKDTQEINVADYADVTGFYNEKDQINLDGYRYYFEKYTYGGATTLKAVAAEYVNMEYTIAAQENAGKLEFKFNGTVKEDIFYNKTAVIDFYVGSTKAYYGAIGADGKFEITVDTSDWPLTTVAYAHFSVIESQEDTTKLFPKSGEYNLVNNDCTTDFKDNGAKAPDGGKDLLTKGTIEMHNSDWTRTFYIGPGEWGGIIAYGYNENASLEVVGDIALKVDSMTEPTKVYYVVTVKVGGKVGYDEAKLKTIVFGNTDGGVVVYKQDTARFAAVEGEEKTYKLWFDVTAHAGKTMLWSNLYFEDAPTTEGGDPTYGDKILEIKDSDCSTNGLYAVVDGKKYTILCTTAANNDAEGEFKNNTYNSSNLVCTDAEATDTNPPTADVDFAPSFEVDMSTLKLELKGGKPTLTIGGTVEGYTDSDIAFDLQTNGVVHSQGGWQTIKPATTVTVADGAFTVTVDLSAVGFHNEAKTNGVTQYLMHLYFGKTTFDIEWKADPVKVDENGDHVVYNNLHYTLIIRKAQSWDRDVVQLAVSEAALAEPDTRSYKIKLPVALEANASENKVYFVLQADVSGYTVDTLKTIKLGNIDGNTRVLFDCANATIANGVATLKFDITGCTAQGLYCNLYVGENRLAEIKDDADAAVTSATLGTKTYSISYSQWHNVLLSVADTAAPTISFKDAELKNDGGTLYFVLKADSTKYTVEQLKTIKFFNGNNKLSVVEAKSTFTADGESTLYFDVTSLEGSSGGEWFWGHMEINGKGFDGGSGDLKPTGTVAETAFEYGNKEYHLTLNGGTQLILIIKTKA